MITVKFAVIALFAFATQLAQASDAGLIADLKEVEGREGRLTVKRGNERIANCFKEFGSSSDECVPAKCKVVYSKSGDYRKVPKVEFHTNPPVMMGDNHDVEFLMPPSAAVERATYEAPDDENDQTPPLVQTVYRYSLYKKNKEDRKLIKELYTSTDYVCGFEHASIKTIQNHLSIFKGGNDGYLVSLHLQGTCTGWDDLMQPKNRSRADTRPVKVFSYEMNCEIPQKK